MRVVVALFPAAAITLILFCLMQYLVSGSRVPLAMPDYPGFVNLIRLQHDPDPQEQILAKRTLPEQSRTPDDSLPVPQPAVTATGTPDFPELAIAMPGLAPLDLDHGPFLAPPGRPAVASTPKVLPDTRTAQQKADAPDMTAASMTASATPATPDMGELSGELTGIGSGDEVIPLLRIEPSYPRKAARAREEGWVKIEFTITEHGTVVDPVVVEARPRRTFNRSALAAIRKWQFKPKLNDGQPVSRRASQVIEFKLANR